MIQYMQGHRTQVQRKHSDSVPSSHMKRAAGATEGDLGRYHVATSKGYAQDDNSRDDQHSKDEPKESLVR